MGNNPKFTVLFEQLRGKTFEIDRDVMSIGRKDENDICLKDGSISGRHAELSKLIIKSMKFIFRKETLRRLLIFILIILR